MRKTRTSLIAAIDWKEVQNYYDQGNGSISCCKHFGFSRSTFTEAVKRRLLKASRKKDFDRAVLRYDWKPIQSYYNRGHNGRECCRKFGCSVLTFEHAAKVGAVKIRPAYCASETLFCAKKQRIDAVHLKHRLLRDRIFTYRCAICGTWRWQDKILALDLHHKNGDPTDDRIKNLEFRCPNCHSQAPIHKGRKNKDALKRRGALKESYYRLVNRIVAEQESDTVGCFPINLRCKQIVTGLADINKSAQQTTGQRRRLKPAQAARIASGLWCRFPVQPRQSRDSPPTRT